MEDLFTTAVSVVVNAAVLGAGFPAHHHFLIA